MLSRVSLRVRIVSFVIAISFILSSLGGVYLYVSVSSSITQTLKNSLQSRADRVIDQIAQGIIERAPINRKPRISSDQEFVQIIAKGGRLEYSTTTAGTKSVIGLKQQNLASNGPIYVSSGDLIYLAATGLSAGEVVAIGSSLDLLTDSQHHILRIVAIGTPLIVIIAALGAFKLADFALRPVERMRKDAQALVEGSLRGRLGVPPTDDELSHLAVTLNCFLDFFEESLSNQRAFIASASHELRTPLSVISGEIELAMKFASTYRELKTAISSVSTRVRTLIELSNGLLELASGDQGTLDLIMEKVNLDEVLLEVIDTYRDRAKEAGVVFYFDEDPNIYLMADRGRVFQAIGNIVDNSLRYSTKGDVISIRTRRQQRVTEIAIFDQGPGFDVGFIPRALLRFTRGEISLQRRSGGAGLGLSIVAMIVDAHNGSVAVANRDSEPGAVVTIELPLAKQPWSHLDLVVG